MSYSSFHIRDGKGIGTFTFRWIFLINDYDRKSSLIFFFTCSRRGTSTECISCLLGYNTLSSVRFRKNWVSPSDYGIHYNRNGMSAFWNLNVVIPANSPFLRICRDVPARMLFWNLNIVIFRDTTYRKIFIAWTEGTPYDVCCCFSQSSLYFFFLSSIIYIYV